MGASYERAADSYEVSAAAPLEEYTQWREDESETLRTK